MVEFMTNPTVQSWLCSLLAIAVAWAILRTPPDYIKDHSKYDVGAFYPQIGGIYVGIMREYNKHYMVFVGPTCMHPVLCTWQEAMKWAAQRGEEIVGVESRLPTIDELKFAFKVIPMVFYQSHEYFWSSDHLLKSAFALNPQLAKTDLLKQEDVDIACIFRLIEV